MWGQQKQTNGLSMTWAVVANRHTLEFGLGDRVGSKMGQNGPPSEGVRYCDVG